MHETCTTGSVSEDCIDEAATVSAARAAAATRAAGSGQQPRSRDCSSATRSNDSASRGEATTGAAAGAASDREAGKALAVVVEPLSSSGRSLVMTGSLDARSRPKQSEGSSRTTRTVNGGSCPGGRAVSADHAECDRQVWASARAREHMRAYELAATHLSNRCSKAEPGGSENKSTAPSSVSLVKSSPVTPGAMS